MNVLVVEGIDPAGLYQEFYIGCHELESCMESVTRLVQEGYKVQAVKLLEGKLKPILLPSAAFDGQSFLSPIQALERDWKTILAC